MSGRQITIRMCDELERVACCATCGDIKAPNNCMWCDAVFCDPCAELLSSCERCGCAAILRLADGLIVSWTGK